MTSSENYVQTKHKDYGKYAEKWIRIRSVIASAVTAYLRDIGKTECDKTYGRERQAEYEDSAIFYNFTKRTVDGMVGSIYRKDPEIELTTSTTYLLTDCDGKGQGIIQQSKKACRDATEIGRGGLFTDMPSAPVQIDSDGNEVKKVITKQDLADGKINPKIQFYPAESIINWRTSRIGSVNKVQMIVLREEYEYQDSDNRFLWLTAYQYRVLELDENGLYQQTLYKYNYAGEATSAVTYTPISNGSRMTEIPFVFIGAENNDYEIDEPPMLTLVNLNIGHYRNSADHEEFLHLLGQAMLTISPSNAIAAKWKENNPDGVKFGARNGLNLGEGGSAQILQAQPNTANSEAMKVKEEQAIQIGAQLITPNQQETAEAARIKQGADTSVLSSIASNVSEAYRMSIQFCMDFLGDTGEFTFKLSQDFFFEKMSAEERAQWVAEIQMGITPRSYYYSAMRRTGQFDPQKDDDDIQEELESEGMGGDNGLIPTVNS